MDNLNKRNWLHRTTAIAQFGVGLGEEVVDIVERMHGSIAQAPLIFADLQNDRPRGLTKFIYAAVRSGFQISEKSLQLLGQWVPELPADDNTTANPESPAWLQFRAAVNGVCGDSLLARQNPLALPMSFTHEQPAPKAQSDTLLLFIHGLCMDPSGWFNMAPEQNHHPQAQAQLATQLNAKTAYLRYNSGRHMSENGAELAKLLEHYAHDQQRIVIIGHSMGGLITRSACYYAQQAGLTWPSKLSHLVTLGSPHHGASLERIGNIANAALMISPYSKPLARLGSLRSAGIQDLRFGNLLHTDWQPPTSPTHFDDVRTPVPLLDTVNYLLVAGTKSLALPADMEPTRAKHDWLVSVASAWNIARHSQFTTTTPANVTRRLYANTTHMQLLWRKNMYDDIAQWLST